MVTFDVDSTYPTPLPGWKAVLGAAADAAGDPSAALHLAPSVAALLPRPGHGDTRTLWQGLADLGAVDLSVARAVEPHLDALAILDEAPGTAVAQSFTDSTTWGVFAAEGPGARLEASTSDRGVRLSGRKPWCSLAGLLDAALVTAWTSERSRALFAVDMRHDGIEPTDSPWASRGLARITSVAVDFDDVPATPVGPDGWYLQRPGFAWGGIGVAAVWWGGAAGLARTMLAATSTREPDQVGRMLLGRADAALHAAAAVLDRAASAVDAGALASEHAWPATVRIRHIVHDACETVLRAAAHGLGPGPLTADEDHARRVSDLEIYLRQHKAERDEALIGDGLLAGMASTWQ
ncbi:MAG: acyl-CoA dehydrogenase [Propionibacteriaceae bacterium]|nr:acyl-CoA dehydrogenase [Propionibacteriaceae bacterium]